MSDSPERPCILVTRPEPGATATEKVLIERGFSVIKRPLTELAAVPVSEDNTDQFLKSDLIIVTSANALRHAPGSLIDAVRQTPVVAVGDATAQQANDLGMVDVISLGGDAETLLAWVLSNVPKSDHIGYLCGRLRRDVIDVGLADHGLKLSSIETYKTQKVSQITEKIMADLRITDPDGVAVFSSVSAQILADLCQIDEICQKFENKLVFAISDRAVDALKDVWPGDMAVSEHKDAHAMHALIADYFFQ
ncbi:MAG: uroporphyrinogen-III synthase [Pseudomonadota bacterium]